MFLCHVCKQQSLPGMPATRVVLERRVKVYPKDGGESVEGWEIVREALAHGGCALTFEGKARADEAARKATGGATLKDLFEGVRAVEDYSAHPDVAPPLDDDLAPGEVVVEFTPEPVPVEKWKIEEAFRDTLAKPKKQKRAKKSKVEEAN